MSIKSEGRSTSPRSNSRQHEQPRRARPPENPRTASCQMKPAISAHAPRKLRLPAYVRHG